MKTSPTPSSPRGPTAKSRVLVVDDQSSMAEMLVDGLIERGYDAVAICSSAEAGKRLVEDRFDALVTDLRMPEIDGLGLLAISKKAVPDRPVILMTAYSAIDSAIESIRQGAYHYVTKPFKVDELVLFLERALDEVRIRREAVFLRRALRDQFSITNLVGSSRAMQEVVDLVMRVAETDASVLITGETGTGKGVVARAIHAEGHRAGAAFVTVNCASLPENLLESELFGHVKGAFTGATSNRVGLFEEAHGGTLFLDEIGEMAPSLQAKLLHVLEQGVVRAVGANKERAVDVRIIAATHRNLRERLREKAFREDLLYRLEVVTIDLPPLRSRAADLPTLVEHFLNRSRAHHPSSPVRAIAQDALAKFFDHAWPGNVRELKHLIERLVILGRSEEVGVSALPANFGTRREESLMFAGDVMPLRDLQRRYAEWAYAQLEGQKLLTAQKLSVDAKTLTRLLDSAESDAVRK